MKNWITVGAGVFKNNVSGVRILSNWFYLTYCILIGAQVGTTMMSWSFVWNFIFYLSGYGEENLLSFKIMNRNEFFKDFPLFFL